MLPRWHALSSSTDRREETGGGERRRRSGEEEEGRGGGGRGERGELQALANERRARKRIAHI